MATQDEGLTLNFNNMMNFENFHNSSTISISVDKSTSLEGLVSETTRYWFEQIVYLWGCSILSYMGIINNIVTIAVFRVMGFNETVNISMTSIAIWDLVRSIAAALTEMYGIVALFSESLGQSWKHITMIVNGYIYAIAGYTSILLASYVAIERCLCVSLPFTVKFLLTRQTVIVTSVVISVVVTMANVVAYANYEFLYVVDGTSNESYIIFQFNSIRYNYPGILVYLYFMNVFYPVLSLFITAICTVIITYHLKKASQTRNKLQGNATVMEASHLTIRDRQVIKMLIVIIIVYIVCFLPRIVFYMTENIFPEFNFGRRYSNVFWCVLYFMIAFDLINSSVNVFIFYSMSSQFKLTLRNMLGCKADAK